MKKITVTEETIKALAEKIAKAVEGESGYTVNHEQDGVVIWVDFAHNRDTTTSQFDHDSEPEENGTVKVEICDLTSIDKESNGYVIINNFKEVVNKLSYEEDV